jgi:hypothetical protein
MVGEMERLRPWYIPVLPTGLMIPPGTAVGDGVPLIARDEFVQATGPVTTYRYVPMASRMWRYCDVPVLNFGTMGQVRDGQGGSGAIEPGGVKRPSVFDLLNGRQLRNAESMYRLTSEIIDEKRPSRDRVVWFDLDQTLFNAGGRGGPKAKGKPFIYRRSGLIGGALGVMAALYDKGFTIGINSAAGRGYIDNFLRRFPAIDEMLGHSADGRKLIRDLQWIVYDATSYFIGIGQAEYLESHLKVHALKLDERNKVPLPKVIGERDILIDDIVFRMLATYESYLSGTVELDPVALRFIEYAKGVYSSPRYVPGDFRWGDARQVRVIRRVLGEAFDDARHG